MSEPIITVRLVLETVDRDGLPVAAEASCNLLETRDVSLFQLYSKAAAELKKRLETRLG